jgi:UPF0271 protein
MIAAAERRGLRAASEVFADRGYMPGGTLVPRTDPGAVIEDAGVVVARAVAMVRDRAVTAIDGSRVPLRADTICVHGDTPGAAELAARVRAALEAADVQVAAVGRRDRSQGS